MATIIERGWRKADPVTAAQFQYDMHYADTMGARVYEWSGEDRDGNPTTVVWVAGKRGGNLFSAYEITE